MVCTVSKEQDSVRTWGLFLERHEHFSGPKNCFMFAMFAFKIKNSINNKMTLSVNEAKFTNL